MRFIAVLVGMLLSSSAFAEDVVLKSMHCKKGSVTRLIESKAAAANKPPCHVTSDGKVLWSAQNTTRYCEAKYLGHKDKLEKMGFKCE